MTETSLWGCCTETFTNCISVLSNVELFPIQTFYIFLLYFICYCILFYDYCLLPLHVYGCAWQLLIKKYDDDDDDDDDDDYDYDETALHACVYHRVCAFVRARARVCVCVSVQCMLSFTPATMLQKSLWKVIKKTTELNRDTLYTSNMSMTESNVV